MCICLHRQFYQAEININLFLVYLIGTETSGNHVNNNGKGE